MLEIKNVSIEQHPAGGTAVTIVFDNFQRVLDYHKETLAKEIMDLIVGACAKQFVEMCGDDIVQSVKLEEVTRLLAKKFVEENFGKVLAEIDPKAVATFAMAKAASMIGEGIRYGSMFDGPEGR